MNFEKKNVIYKLLKGIKNMNKTDPKFLMLQQQKYTYATYLRFKNYDILIKRNLKFTRSNKIIPILVI
jgi:hypothetical protein